MGFVREAIKTPKPLINVGFHQINFSKRLQRSSYIVCLNNEIKRKNLKISTNAEVSKIISQRSKLFRRLVSTAWFTPVLPSENNNAIAITVDGRVLIVFSLKHIDHAR